METQHEKMSSSFSIRAVEPSSAHHQDEEGISSSTSYFSEMEQLREKYFDPSGQVIHLDHAGSTSKCSNG